jgi:hypothetical protein
VEHTVGAGRGDTYVVHCRDAVQAVLRDGEAFSSRINDDTMGPYMGKTILAMDGDEHRAYRNLVASAFRASSLERWGDEVITPSVNALLDDIAPRGEADLVHDLTARFPWLVAFSFGLLHGFGFASALAAVGMPAKAVPLALLFFNVGVEIGQLVFIAAVLATGKLVRRATFSAPPWWPRAAAYGIGSVAAFWFVQRTVAIF